jgi:hypothetical protein
MIQDSPSVNGVGREVKIDGMSEARSNHMVSISIGRAS